MRPPVRQLPPVLLLAGGGGGGGDHVGVVELRGVEGAHCQHLHYQVLGQRFVTLESLGDDVRASVVEHHAPVLDLTAVHGEDEASVDEISA